jgi:hypothetical protein
MLMHVNYVNGTREGFESVLQDVELTVNASSIPLSSYDVLVHDTILNSTDVEMITLFVLRFDKR